jgi:transposase
MLKLASETRVFVADRPVDFRKAINGLVAQVDAQFEQLPTSGSVYVFYNRLCDRVKCLFWDKNGFVLYQKRLERGRFKFGKSPDGAFSITQSQLDWLLAGLDFQLMHEFPELDFTHYF